MSEFFKHDEFHNQEKRAAAKKGKSKKDTKLKKENKKHSFYFLEKYLPKNCAKGGYVHMFPAFYKHCVIFDMDLYEKDWYELFVIPYMYILRKFLVLLELAGLAYY